MRVGRAEIVKSEMKSATPATRSYRTGPSSCRLFLTALFTATLLCAGCGKTSPPPTLIIHLHADGYDVIDHRGGTLTTVQDLDELEAFVRKPEIQRLISNNRVVLRFEGIRQDDGVMLPPDEVGGVSARLLHHGVTMFDLDNTNANDDTGAIE